MCQIYSYFGNALLSLKIIDTNKNYILLNNYDNKYKQKLVTNNTCNKLWLNNYNNNINLGDRHNLEIFVEYFMV